MAEKIKRDRQSFIHNGQTIYEWEQTLEDVDVYLTAPPGTKAKFIDCKITSNKVTVGLKGNPPYLEVGKTTSKD
jgi:hypothetical protein